MANQDNLVISVLVSQSSVIASITKQFTNFIKNALPSNLLKNVFIGDGSQSIQTFFKKKDYHTNIPTLIATPRFELLKPEFDGTCSFPNYVMSPLASSNEYSDFMSYRGIAATWFLMKDETKGIEINYTSTRTRLESSFILRVESPLQMMNLKEVLKKKLFVDNPFYHNHVAIPIQISSNLIGIICRFLNLDINLIADINTLRDYFKTHFRFQVDYAVDSSTGNTNFFYIYKTNILFKFSDISSTVNKVGKSLDRATITFSGFAELNIPEMYFVVLDNLVEPFFEVNLDEFNTEPDSNMISFGYSMISSPRNSWGDKYTSLLQVNFILDNTGMNEDLNLSSHIPDSLKEILNTYSESFLSENLVFKVADERNYYIDDLEFEFYPRTQKLYLLDGKVNVTQTFIIYGTKEVLEILNKDALIDMSAETSI